jgi:thiol-disulfide isomerase/thioredoxin
VKVIVHSGRAAVPVDPRVSGASRIETLPPLDGATGPAPAFTLEDREGRRVSLAHLRGAPLLIDFWASWCGPCRKSMPAIEQLYRKYRGRGLQVVGINIEGRSTATLDYLNAGDYTFPILFDSGNWNSPVARSYRVSSIPRTFLIDGDGNILFAGHPDRLPASMLEAALR